MFQAFIVFLQENAANAGDTITSKTFISAVITFVLGLLAKVIYDLWKERRKRKILVFTKTVLSSFSPNNLEENIRKTVAVTFQGRIIHSIQLVRVEVENLSSKSLKKQAFTVRFNEKAEIIGTPKSIGSTEDFRYIKPDTSATTSNSQRFILDLLQKGRPLAWEFAVINHPESDFVVEHGLATIEDKDADLDVLATITSDRAQINLAGRIQRVVRLLIYIQIASLMTEFLPRTLLGPIASLSTPLFTIAIIWLLLILLREATLIVPSFMEWWRNDSNREHITIETGRQSNIVVAPHGTATLRNVMPDADALRAFLSSADPQSLNEAPVGAATTPPTQEKK